MHGNEATSHANMPAESPLAAVQLALRPKTLTEGLKPEYTIDRYPVTIGRHPTNDIELPFDAVSRYHARVELFDGKPRVVDLNSSNGTYINARRVQLAQLEDQDSLSFGSLEFTVVTLEAAVYRVEAGSEDSPTSVQFLVDDEPSEPVYHTELPDDTSSVTYLNEEITNETQLKKAKERLVCLYRLQDVLRTTIDEEKMLRRALGLIFEVLPVDRGVILTRDQQDPAVFRPIAVKNKLRESGDKIGISKTILQRSLREKVAVLTRDARADARFNESESIMTKGLRSVMCVPLISMRHVFGFIHLDTTESVRSFTQEDLTFMASVAAEIATHLHNLRMMNDKITSERMAAIGQTITGMAHNIKNILVLTQGGIEMMEKRLTRKNYETLDETWMVVRRGIERINGLVAEMLNYARARNIQKQKAQVNELIEELRQSFADEMAKRGLKCALDLDRDVPKLMLDVDGLQKSLENLILNAMEACEEGQGEIQIKTATADDGNLLITVADNGAGIPRELLTRIFVPFFTTKGSKGSGLGLAMTRKCIEDMGGRINVESAEGKGAKFTITIYTAPPDPRIADGSQTKDSAL